MSTDFDGKKVSQTLGSVHVKSPAVDFPIKQKLPWSSEKNKSIHQVEAVTFRGASLGRKLDITKKINASDKDESTRFQVKKIIPLSILTQHPKGKRDTEVQHGGRRRTSSSASATQENAVVPLSFDMARTHTMKPKSKPSKRMFKQVEVSSVQQTSRSSSVASSTRKVKKSNAEGRSSKSSGRPSSSSSSLSSKSSPIEQDNDEEEVNVNDLSGSSFSIDAVIPKEDVFLKMVNPPNPSKQDGTSDQKAFHEHLQLEVPKEPSSDKVAEEGNSPALSTESGNNLTNSGAFSTGNDDSTQEEEDEEDTSFEPPNLEEIQQKLGTKFTPKLTSKVLKVEQISRAQVRKEVEKERLAQATKQVREKELQKKKEQEEMVQKKAKIHQLSELIRAQNKKFVPQETSATIVLPSTSSTSSKKRDSMEIPFPLTRKPPVPRLGKTKRTPSKSSPKRSKSREEEEEEDHEPRRLLAPQSSYTTKRKVRIVKKINLNVLPAKKELTEEEKKLQKQRRALARDFMVLQRKTRQFSAFKERELQMLEETKRKKELEKLEVIRLERLKQALERKTRQKAKALKEEALSEQPQSQESTPKPSASQYVLGVIHSEQIENTRENVECKTSVVFMPAEMERKEEVEPIVTDDLSVNPRIAKLLSLENKARQLAERLNFLKKSQNPTTSSKVIETPHPVESPRHSIQTMQLIKEDLAGYLNEGDDDFLNGDNSDEENHNDNDDEGIASLSEEEHTNDEPDEMSDLEMEESFDMDTAEKTIENVPKNDVNATVYSKLVLEQEETKEDDVEEEPEENFDFRSIGVPAAVGVIINSAPVMEQAPQDEKQDFEEFRKNLSSLSSPSSASSSEDENDDEVADKEINREEEEEEEEDWTLDDEYHVEKQQETIIPQTPKEDREWREVFTTSTVQDVSPIFKRNGDAGLSDLLRETDDSLSLIDSLAQKIYLQNQKQQQKAQLKHEQEERAMVQDQAENEEAVDNSSDINEEIEEQEMNEVDEEEQHDIVNCGVISSLPDDKVEVDDPVQISSQDADPATFEAPEMYYSSRAIPARVTIDTSELLMQQKQYGSTVEQREPARMLSPRTLSQQLLAQVEIHEAIQDAHLQLTMMEQAHVLKQVQEESLSYVNSLKEEVEQNTQAHQMALNYQTLEKQFDQDLQQMVEQFKVVQEQEIQAHQTREQALQDELRRLKQREESVQTEGLVMHQDAATNVALVLDVATLTDDQPTHVASSLPQAQSASIGTATSIEEVEKEYSTPDSALVSYEVEASKDKLVDRSHQYEEEDFESEDPSQTHVGRQSTSEIKEESNVQKDDDDEASFASSISEDEAEKQEDSADEEVKPDSAHSLTNEISKNVSEKEGRQSTSEIKEESNVQKDDDDEASFASSISEDEAEKQEDSADEEVKPDSAREDDMVSEEESEISEESIKEAEVEDDEEEAYDEDFDMSTSMAQQTDKGTTTIQPVGHSQSVHTTMSPVIVQKPEIPDDMCVSMDCSDEWRQDAIEWLQSIQGSESNVNASVYMEKLLARRENEEKIAHMQLQTVREKLLKTKKKESEIWIELKAQESTIKKELSVKRTLFYSDLQWLKDQMNFICTTKSSTYSPTKKQTRKKLLEKSIELVESLELKHKAKETLENEVEEYSHDYENEMSGGSSKNCKRDHLEILEEGEAEEEDEVEDDDGSVKSEVDEISDDDEDSKLRGKYDDDEEEDAYEGEGFNSMSASILEDDAKQKDLKQITSIQDEDEDEDEIEEEEAEDERKEQIESKSNSADAYSEDDFDDAEEEEKAKKSDSIALETPHENVANAAAAGATTSTTTDSSSSDSFTTTKLTRQNSFLKKLFATVRSEDTPSSEKEEKENCMDEEDEENESRLLGKEELKLQLKKEKAIKLIETKQKILQKQTKQFKLQEESQQIQQLAEMALAMNLDQELLHAKQEISTQVTKEMEELKQKLKLPIHSPYIETLGREESTVIMSIIPSMKPVMSPKLGALRKEEKGAEEDDDDEEEAAYSDDSFETGNSVASSSKSKATQEEIVEDADLEDEIASAMNEDEDGIKDEVEDDFENEDDFKETEVKEEEEEEEGSNVIRDEYADDNFESVSVQGDQKGVHEETPSESASVAQEYDDDEFEKASSIASSYRYESDFEPEERPVPLPPPASPPVSPVKNFSASPQKLSPQRESSPKKEEEEEEEEEEERDPTVLSPNTSVLELSRALGHVTEQYSMGEEGDADADADSSDLSVSKSLEEHEQRLSKLASAFEAKKKELRTLQKRITKEKHKQELYMQERAMENDLENLQDEFDNEKRALELLQVKNQYEKQLVLTKLEQLQAQKEQAQKTFADLLNAFDYVEDVELFPILHADTLEESSQLEHSKNLLASYEYLEEASLVDVVAPALVAQNDQETQTLGTVTVQQEEIALESADKELLGSYEYIEEVDIPVDTAAIVKEVQQDMDEVDNIFESIDGGDSFSPPEEQVNLYMHTMEKAESQKQQEVQEEEKLSATFEHDVNDQDSSEKPTVAESITASKDVTEEEYSKELEESMEEHEDEMQVSLPSKEEKAEKLSNILFDELYSAIVSSHVSLALDAKKNESESVQHVKLRRRSNGSILPNKLTPSSSVYQSPPTSPVVMTKPSKPDETTLATSWGSTILSQVEIHDDGTLRVPALEDLDVLQTTQQDQALLRLTYEAVENMATDFFTYYCESHVIDTETHAKEVTKKLHTYVPSRLKKLLSIRSTAKEDQAKEETLGEEGYGHGSRGSGLLNKSLLNQMTSSSYGRLSQLINSTSIASTGTTMSTTSTKSIIASLTERHEQELGDRLTELILKDLMDEMIKP